jgi:hypothetical protein
MAKFTITMKDPDFSTDRNVLKSEMRVLDIFMDCREYIEIEFDTVTKTARVIDPRMERV